MKTYAKIENDIVIYHLKSDTQQYGLIEIDFDIGKPPSSGQVFKYSSKTWVDIRTEEEKYSSSVNNIKINRIRFLQESDWTQLPDVPLETKQAWATYRQALRDITNQEGYPFNVIWPTKPE